MARKLRAVKATARRTQSKRQRNTNGNGHSDGRKPSVKNIRALRAMAQNVKTYTPIIEEKLRDAGIVPDPAVVYSAAKYYEALDRLAQE